MSFKYTVQIPNEDGEGVEDVELVFKDIKDLPVGIIRRHRRDVEAQMWATFEWGLSPEHLELFDRMPASGFRDVLKAWQESEDAEDE